MPYPLRAIGGAGILLAVVAPSLGFPWYVTAVGGILCLVFLAEFVRELVG